MKRVTLCAWQGCTRGNTMGTHCIEHWYSAQGKKCPDMPAPRATMTMTRPALDRNTVAVGSRQTSWLAAERAFPKSGTQRARIWELIKEHAGLTADQVNELTGISPNSINPAVNSLAKDGWLLDSGERRPTRSGCDAIVWVVAP